MKLLLLLLTWVAVNALDDCPKDCTCIRSHGGGTATCTRLDPSYQLFPDYIIHLVLKSDQRNVSLEDKIFFKLGLDQLYSITAINSSITFVHANAFEGLDKLNSVDLSHNNIILIHRDTFKKNTNLKSLQLTGNPLQLTQVLKSEQDYFLNSLSLRDLDLSHCQLAELKPNTFSQLPNLEYVNLASNGLKELNPETFNNVKFLDEINLSNNYISSLATELFYDIDDLTILNLCNNSLHNINNIDISDLKQLDISYNFLTELNDITFDGVPDLTHLNIKNNLIEYVSEDSFSNLPELRYLDLSNNRLKTPLPSYLFEQNKDLETLSLAGNKNLTKLNQFNGLFNLLYKLDISNCGLQTLEDESLKSMPNIAILNMSGNAFSDLHQSTFAVLHRLNDLDLSHNNITKLETDVFVNNSHLRKLNLSYNKIHHIPVRVFKPIPRLTILDLSHNYISYLWHLNNSEYIKFNHILDKVEYLNLNSNQLKSVHRTNFEIFESLKRLDIFNNPLQCGPLFATLVEWLISHGITSDKYVGQSMPLNTALESEIKDVQWGRLWEEVCKKPYIQDALPAPTILPNIPPAAELGALPDDSQQNAALTEESEDKTNTDNFTYKIEEPVDIESRLSEAINEAEDGVYIWPMILFVLCALSILLAIGNLLVLIVYKLRGSNPYKGNGYKSAFIAPFRHTGMKSDGSSRYHKLYEECSVPNPPVVRSKVFTAPILDSLAKLHYSVITKPESKDENLI